MGKENPINVVLFTGEKCEFAELKINFYYDDKFVFFKYVMIQIKIDKSIHLKILK